MNYSRFEITLQGNYNTRVKETYRVPRTEWMCLMPNDGSGIAIERLGLIDDRKFDQFKGPHVLVPEVGFMRIDGSRGFTYMENYMGLAVIDDKLVMDRAEIFDVRGLFNIRAEIQSTNPNLIGAILDCNMKLPEGTQLTSQLHSESLDEADLIIDAEELGIKPPEEDLEVRDYSVTELWKMDGDDRHFMFFAPADPDFLSRLRFQLIPILTKKRPI